MLSSISISQLEAVQPHVYIYIYIYVYIILITIRVEIITGLTILIMWQRYVWHKVLKTKHKFIYDKNIAGQPTLVEVVAYNNNIYVIFACRDKLLVHMGIFVLIRKEQRALEVRIILRRNKRKTHRYTRVCSTYSLETINEKKFWWFKWNGMW